MSCLSTPKYQGLCGSVALFSQENKEKLKDKLKTSFTQSSMKLKLEQSQFIPSSVPAMFTAAYALRSISLENQQLRDENEGLQKQVKFFERELRKYSSELDGARTTQKSLVESLEHQNKRNQMLLSQNRDLRLQITFRQSKVEPNEVQNKEFEEDNIKTIGSCDANDVRSQWLKMYFFEKWKKYIKISQAKIKQKTNKSNDAVSTQIAKIGEASSEAIDSLSVIQKNVIHLLHQISLSKE
ncbi:uncharacterized protein MONOS_8666 [Monocercomonoides exilis]|uniref:uncharacterized protein n=1 Tax=Monocercomonoides exilis TaxID=2049356 RepID=UPI00355A7EF3|nr:hypothetical protein MONOS_8666 [Monocercomonoides exilis]|eukprot:MONOS_8666.1-p1 / transcript=MONOS_8666.1 / gene=MONOS_8666 / organism=Monocercomonoides_exilis_PA203 / gene_product=unspecified product / transcript_product=unspecified product / location=Mono_scaffold00333:5520-6302(-) / protein_length=240 / sequence_SO=supercontig / SO=protein_coding / is_pseudo=false